ncbi:MAG: hypothetical protein GXO63_02005 [Candidatus Micrarchaeota archaeon]|nr:hypothetical protein [Candidatus Micrarchaeota archaeon]
MFRNFTGKQEFSRIKKLFKKCCYDVNYFFNFSLPKGSVPYLALEAPLEDRFREEMFMELSETLNELLKTYEPEYIILQPPVLSWYEKSKKLDRKLYTFTKKILRRLDHPVHFLNVTSKSKWYYTQKLGTSPFENIEVLKKITGRKVYICLDPIAALNSIEYNYPIVIKEFRRKIGSVIVANAEIVGVEDKWIYQRTDKFRKGCVPWRHIIALLIKYCKNLPDMFIETETLGTGIETKNILVNLYDSIVSEFGVSG